MNKKSKWIKWFLYGITALTMLLAGIASVFAPPQQFEATMEAWNRPDGAIVVNVRGMDSIKLPKAEVRIEQKDLTLTMHIDAENEHHAVWWSTAQKQLDMANAVVSFETEPSQYDLNRRFDLLPLAVSQIEPVIWTCASRQITKEMIYLLCSQTH